MDTTDWLQIRKDAAARIDPTTAEVTFNWGQVLDPYGVDPDLPPDCYQVGRIYFARNPDEEIWVSFYDLPEPALKILWDRIDRGEIRDPA
jgi:hypothetical protein